MPADFWVRANLGLIVRGPVISLQVILDELGRLVETRPDLILVYSIVSAGKIYIREGEHP